MEEGIRIAFRNSQNLPNEYSRGGKQNEKIIADR
jgi:hypothetical protein